LISCYLFSLSVSKEKPNLFQRSKVSFDNVERKSESIFPSPFSSSEHLAIGQKSPFMIMWSALMARFAFRPVIASRYTGGRPVPGLFTPMFFARKARLF